jgi:hypothetical protein
VATRVRKKKWSG